MYGLSFDGSFLAWRELARAALQAEVHPSAISWYPEVSKGPRELFAETWEDTLPAARRQTPSVPRAFLEGAQLIAYHRHEGKWDFLYRLLWRLTEEGSALLEIRSDPEVHEFYRMQQALHRDAHKMKAFVRFRKIQRAEAETYIAWHQPDHPLLRYVAPFFQDRFRVMRWTIFTPDESVAWDGQRLHWGPGCSQAEVESKDQLEELWSCYYASIFNPARVKVKAMKAEMAVRYWKSLPETALIPELLADAPERLSRMLAQTPQSAAHLVPEQPELLSTALKACAICSFACQRPPCEALGPLDAPWLLVLPSAQETGLLSEEAEAWLRDLFAEQQWPWQQLRITAAVKHPKPSALEPRDLAACKPWLASEIKQQKPKVIVCVGLHAGLAVFGRLLRWTEVEGREFVTPAAPRTLVTRDIETCVRLPAGAERERLEQRIRADFLKLPGSPSS